MIKIFFKLFKSILLLTVIIIAFLFAFSIKTDMSLENTIAYFKLIGCELFNINIPENIPVNTDNIQINTSANNNYYYEQLDENGKIIYTAFENNIDNLKKDNYVIDFSTTFNELLNKSYGQYKLGKSFQSALDAFFYDHPELFYIDITKLSLNTKCISIGNIKNYTVKIAPSDNKNYLNSNFKSEPEVNRAINEIKNIKKEIINTVSNYSTYNKIKEIHNILVNSIEYDSTYKKSNTHNIYGALVEKKVVCEGYAKAFKYLMDELEIECILVSGNAYNDSNEPESHMWNYVKLNNEWYGVDVTWDDPIINGGSIKNNLRHDYFLKGYYAFVDTHSPSGKITEDGMLFKIPNLSYSNFR